MEITKYLKDPKNIDETVGYEDPEYWTRKKLECNDGFSMSVQASKYHYCTPRANLRNGRYETAEVSFPSEREMILESYSCSFGVYAFVPLEDIEEIIHKHGGIKHDT